MDFENTTKKPSWLRAGDQSIFYWYYKPVDCKASVLLVPSIGHEAYHCHRFYNRLAEVLCANNIEVIRFDLPGTQDSLGTVTDKQTFTCWPECLSLLESQFQENTDLTLIGFRMGATIADFFCGRSSRVQRFIALEPVLSGKRFSREINATSRVSETNSLAEDFLEAGGFQYTHEFLDWISTLKLDFSAKKQKVLVYTKSERTRKSLERLNLEHVKTQTLRHYEDIIAEPQFTRIPEDLIFSIVTEITDEQPTKVRKPVALRLSEKAKVEGNDFIESCFTDSLGQFGIITSPTTTQVNRRLLFVLVNSGSGTHTGPNRVYVEISRSLVHSGITTVRFDMKNLADSYTIGTEQENHCYPKESTHYYDAMIKALKLEYPDYTFVIGGICSGSHHSFHYALKHGTNVSAAICINPLTFYWKEGMSLKTPEEQRTTVDANYYANVIRDPNAWIKLLKGKANVRYILLFIQRFITKKTSNLISSMKEILQPIPNTRFNCDIATIRQSNTNLEFIISDSDPGWGLIRDNSMLSKVKFLKRLRVKGHTIPRANHTFSSQESRRKLCSLLAEILSQYISDSESKLLQTKLSSSSLPNSSARAREL
ncbi:alpha/beta hydrolase [Reinekea sp. G2M2-21]|uniref:alpha/beta hydrolase n=1 Tax=Reinekea sp. G2M2-21 TaxID=2788942 RepID=UPI0018A8A692|nr:hypothetical protein [Reinekea sp. G2M2-21]